MSKLLLSMVTRTTLAAVTTVAVDAVAVTVAVGPTVAVVAVADAAQVADVAALDTASPTTLPSGVVAGMTMTTARTRRGS